MRNIKYTQKTGIDLIIAFCLDVIITAVNNGISTENIKVYLHPELKKALNLDDHLIVTHEQEYRLPVIECNFLPFKSSHFDDDIETNIFVGDTGWDWKW